MTRTARVNGLLLLKNTKVQAYIKELQKDIEKQAGSQRQFIAKRYGVTPATLLNWLKRHDLNALQPKP